MNYNDSLINKILPEEILEKIFSMTSQYRDYNNISIVCLKWNRIISGLRKINKKKFAISLENGQIQWKCFDLKSSPSVRHSHSSARIGDRLFIFGGLSGASTSYNDLWIFDLNDKSWSRPFINGTYPSPKAAASFLAYKNQSLILYGGYSYSFSNQFNQQAYFFDELHIYFVSKDTFWCSQIIFSQDAPKLAGHSASLIDKNKMILFGGCNGSLGNKTNDVYCLDLDKNNWISTFYLNKNNTNEIVKKKDTSLTYRQIDGLLPEPRYGHSQITLDDERILIIGGCCGPNKLYDDVWILNWPINYNSNAFWNRVIVQNQINSPYNMYCISFVRCENKLVTFGRTRVPTEIPIQFIQTSKSLNDFKSFYLNGNPLTISGKNRKLELRNCTCSPRSFLKNFNNMNESINFSKILLSSSDRNLTVDRSYADHFKRNTNKNLETINKMDSELESNKSKTYKNKRLEELNKKEFKLNKLKEISNCNPDSIQKLNSKKQCVVHSKVMQTFILDLNPLLTINKNDDFTNNNFVKWQTPITEIVGAPTNTILYSINNGINELILFGGIESPSTNLLSSYEILKHRMSNKLYIMKPIN